jgi:chromosome partitioning protein
MNKIGIMRGRLRDFDLAQVLQVVGIGRQYTGVEVRDDSAVFGTIFVKAGKVVRVEAEDTEGRDALFKLFEKNDGQFFVFRTETPERLPEPIGALQGLLLEAMDRASSPRPAALSASSPPFAQAESPTQVGIAPPATGSAPGAGARTAETTPKSAVEGTGSPAPRPEPRTSSSSSLRAATSSSRAAGKSGRIVAIASPKGGCGKTTIALNLSLSLARQGRSVLLVDADINGDILSSIDARGRAEAGALDVLLGVASVDDALLGTVLPHFKILPAVGGQLPRAELIAADHSAGWRALLSGLTKRAEIVIVDTPAGMFGVTQQVLAASTHVVGILQAEVVANRSFSRFSEGLRGLTDEQRPEVLGIVVNMLQTKHAASLSVFQSACSDLPAEWLFDTSIPRHRAFLDSTQQGLPLRHVDDQSPPAVAWLFDNLAAEITERLKLSPVEKKPFQLLL